MGISLGKGVRLTIDIENKWPLIVATLPGEKALQKELTPNLPSRYPQKPIVMDNGVKLKSDTFWEKGSFVDIYV